MLTRQRMRLGAAMLGFIALGVPAGWAWARTIYANKIEADEVQGVIHQTKDVKIGDASGKIRAPKVAASEIFAEEIHARSR